MEHCLYIFICYPINIQNSIILLRKRCIQIALTNLEISNQPFYQLYLSLNFFKMF